MNSFKQEIEIDEYNELDKDGIDFPDPI